MSYAVQDHGQIVMLAVYGARHVPLLAIVDDADLVVIAQFIGPTEFTRPYADRIAQLLNTHGAVDDAELTSITDQGETT